MLSQLSGLKQAIFCKSLVLFTETFAPVGGWKKCKTLKQTGIHLYPRTAFTIGWSKKCEKKSFKIQYLISGFSRHLRTIDSHELSRLFRNPSWCTQAKYTASKPNLGDTQSVKFDKESEKMFWKTSHIHKKSSTVLNFSKESSLKVLEMISSELKSPEVSVPVKKKTL